MPPMKRTILYRRVTYTKRHGKIVTSRVLIKPEDLKDVMAYDANHIIDNIVLTGKKPTWSELVEAIQTRGSWSVYSFDRNILDKLYGNDIPIDPSQLDYNIRQVAQMTLQFVVRDNVDTSTALKCWKALKRNQIQCMAKFLDGNTYDLLLEAHNKLSSKVNCCGVWQPISRSKFSSLNDNTLVGYRGYFVYCQ